MAPTITRMPSPRWKPSVTVAAIAEQVVDGQRRFLLIEEHTPEGLRLNNPAGHLDEGESTLQAVQRECLEETACVFAPQALLGVYLARFVPPALVASGAAPADDVTYLRFAYSGTVGPPDLSRPLDRGIVRRLWLTADEVRASAHLHRSPLVLRCIEDHIAGVRHALDVVWADASLQAPGPLGA